MVQMEIVTTMQAYVGLERGIRCFPNPHISSVDGLELEAYLPSADETCIAEDGTEVNYQRLYHIIVVVRLFFCCVYMVTAGANAACWPLIANVNRWYA